MPRHNPVMELYGQFLRPHGLFFALACTVNFETLNRRVCLAKSCPMDLIQVNIKDDQWKQDASELNFESHSKGFDYLCK